MWFSTNKVLGQTAMTTLFVLIAVVLLELPVFATGSVNFQNVTLGLGKGVPIYGISSSHPFQAAQGGTDDYSDRQLLSGNTYTAGLFIDRQGTWIVVATKGFRTHPSEAGYLQGGPGVNVDWVRAGDPVDLVVRVWDSRASSWQDVIKPENDWMGRGESIPILGYMAGGDRDGQPILNKNLQDAGLESFGLYIITEPRFALLIGMAMGMFRWCHLHNSSVLRAPGHRVQ
jgi:hypothetical protein